MLSAMKRGCAIALFLTFQACAQPPAGTAAPGANAAANPTAPLSTIKNVTVNGKTYTSGTAALEALRATNAEFVDHLAKETDPLKGRALVIIPDHDRLRPLMAQHAEARLKRPVIGEALDFYIEEERLSLRAMADALVKGNAFESVSVVEQNDTRNPDIGTADYLVWYQVRTIQPDNTGAWLAHWQIRRAGSDAITGAAMDPGVAAGTPRYASFVKSVRDGALRLGGTSLAGGIAGTQPTGDKSRRVVGSGSGIIIDSQGHIVTNNHVVATCPELRVIDAANENVAAAVVARDATNDLALLKATHHWPVMASFREGGDLRQGEQVVVAGYPLGTLLSSNMSVTTGSLTSLTGPRDDSRLLQVTAPVQPGNSGGPLLDGSGAVIGVVTGTLNGMVLAVATGAIPQNVNFALKAAVVRTFLDTNRIGWTKASARSELTAADIGDIARKFTVRVECRR